MDMMASYLTKLIGEMAALLKCRVDVVEDRSLRCSSKIEFARNYAREHHVLRVNPELCRNDYPVFSVLLTTKLQLQEMPGGAVGVLQPVSGPQENARFHADFKADPVGRKLIAQLGTGADSLIASLQGALVVQTCNQVLEMLGADVVLRDYPDAVADMKEFLASAAVEGAQIGYEELLRRNPAFIVDTNRILNLMYAMKCGEVCGKRLIDAYGPTPDEVDKALDLYNFYRAERDSLMSSGKIVGDVLRNILRAVKVERYVHHEVREIAPLAPVAEDDGDGLTDEQRASLKEFYENYGDGKPDSELMALGMYKVLREVERMPLEFVRTLAVEIAMLGANGISPKGRYSLKSFPNRRDIPGLEILAYYYVTWAKVFPERLDALGLPYKQAYDRAVAMLRG